MTVRIVLKLRVQMFMLAMDFSGLAQADPYEKCRWKNGPPHHKRR
jgi:hypothetical protein